MRRSRHGIGGFLLAIAVLSGCVFPRPPAGEPVPALIVSLSAAEPVSGTVTVTATPSNFSPAKVTFRVDGGSPATDSEAPFETTVDTRLLAEGNHDVSAVGKDNTYTVVEHRGFVVRNKPNVVLVLVDDLDAFAPIWDAMPQTRALVTDHGRTFTNAFATDPICCPARVSILTGRYPHNTGVFDNSAPDGGFTQFRNGADTDTVAVRLAGAGYRTAMIGAYLAKYEFFPSYVPPGWNEWFALTKGYFDGFDYEASHNGVVESFGTEETDYQTDVLRERALSFISATETEDHQPFFLYLTPSAPHLPIGPAPRHAANVFTDDSLPMRPNYDEADVSDKPTWLRDGVSPVSPGVHDFFTSDYRNGMGSLLAVDEMIAALVESLETNDELNHTVFVFTSDNGYLRGSHRLAAKQAPYEESIRVPLVVRGPGVATGTQDSLVTNIDLAPTLLALAGVDGSDLDGRSLVPLLTGTTAWRDDFLVEFHGTYSASEHFHTFADVQAAIADGRSVNVPTYRALRTTEWLYVEWYDGSPHEYELYDLTADPYQLTNLLATPEGTAQYQAIVSMLQSRLDQLAACSGASCHE